MGVAQKTLVQPMLGYHSPIWDPYQIDLTEELEKIQEEQAHLASAKASRKCSANYSVRRSKRDIACHIMGYWSCPDAPATCDWNFYNSAEPNAHVLYGALMGGPDANDAFTDTRTDWAHTEPTLDYNAGFQGVLAAMIQLGL